jgi:Uma2 family endonuclease
MKAARRRATYQDVLGAPQHMVAEVVDGELYTSPRPRSPHAFAGSAINQDLGPFSRRPGSPAGPGGWWILYEPELHLGEDILVPDLAGWKHERLPRVPDVSYFELNPDWACEIVSSGTGHLDRDRKMPLYAREGLPHFWIVDPILRTVEVYRLQGLGWFRVTTYLERDVVRIEPFEDLELDLSRWWIDS